MKKLATCLMLAFWFLPTLSSADVFGDEPPIAKRYVQSMKNAAECLKLVRQVAAWEGFQRPVPSDEAPDVGIKNQSGDWIGNSIFENGVCTIHIWTHTFR